MANFRVVRFLIYLLFCFSGMCSVALSEMSDAKKPSAQYLASLEIDCARGSNKTAQKFIGVYVIACHNLGFIRFSQRMYNEALRAYTQSLALESQYAPEWCNRGDVYLAMEKFTDALRDFDKCIEISPKLARAYPQRASAFAKTNNINLAIIEMDKYINLKPNDAIGYMLRSSLHEKAGNNVAALSDYEEAVKIDPKIRKLKPRPCDNCNI